MDREDQQASFKRRIVVTLLFVFFFILGYGLTNHFPVFPLKKLPLTPVDGFFSFQPWTVWFYISDYLLIFTPLFLIRNKAFETKVFMAYFINFVLHSTIFLFFPTTFPRVPIETTDLSTLALNVVRTLDAPNNVFPSQHVSLCYLVSLSFWQQHRKRSILFLIWSTAIAISTMTTKQHYFLDVVAGLVLAVAIYTPIFCRSSK